MVNSIAQVRVGMTWEQVESQLRGWEKPEVSQALARAGLKFDGDGVLTGHRTDEITIGRTPEAEARALAGSNMAAAATSPERALAMSTSPAPASDGTPALKSELAKWAVDKKDEFLSDLKVGIGIGPVDLKGRFEISDSSTDPAIRAFLAQHPNGVVVRTELTFDADGKVGLGGDIEAKLVGEGAYKVVIEVPFVLPETSIAGAKEAAKAEFARLKERALGAAKGLVLDAAAAKELMASGEFPAGTAITRTLTLKGGFEATPDDASATASRKTRVEVKHYFQADGKIVISAGRKREIVLGGEGILPIGDGGIGGSARLERHAESKVVFAIDPNDTGDAAFLDATLPFGNSGETGIKRFIPKLVDFDKMAERSEGTTREFGGHELEDAGGSVYFTSGVFSAGAGGGYQKVSDFSARLSGLDRKAGAAQADRWREGELEKLLTGPGLSGARFSRTQTDEVRKNAQIAVSEGIGNEWVGATAALSFRRDWKETDRLSQRLELSADGQTARVVTDKLDADQFIKKITFKAGVTIPDSFKEELRAKLDEYFELGGDGRIDDLVDKLKDKVTDESLKLVRKVAKRLRFEVGYSRELLEWGRSTESYAGFSMRDPVHRKAAAELLEGKPELALRLGMFEAVWVRDVQEKKPEVTLNLAGLKYSLLRETITEGHEVTLNANGKVVKIKAVGATVSQTRDGIDDTSFVARTIAITVAGQPTQIVTVVGYHSDENILRHTEAAGIVGATEPLGMTISRDVTIDRDDFAGFLANIFLGGSYGGGTIDMGGLIKTEGAIEVLTTSPEEAKHSSRVMAASLSKTRPLPTFEDIATAFGIKDLGVLEFIGGSIRYAQGIDYNTFKDDEADPWEMREYLAEQILKYANFDRNDMTRFQKENWTESDIQWREARRDAVHGVLREVMDTVPANAALEEMGRGGIQTALRGKLSNDVINSTVAYGMLLDAWAQFAAFGDNDKAKAEMTLDETYRDLTGRRLLNDIWVEERGEIGEARANQPEVAQMREMLEARLAIPEAERPALTAEQEKQIQDFVRQTFVQMAEKNRPKGSMFDFERDANSMATWTTMLFRAKGDMEVFFRVETEYRKFTAATKGLGDNASLEQMFKEVNLERKLREAARAQGGRLPQ